MLERDNKHSTEQCLQLLQYISIVEGNEVASLDLLAYVCKYRQRLKAFDKWIWRRMKGIS